MDPQLPGGQPPAAGSIPSAAESPSDAAAYAAAGGGLSSTQAAEPTQPPQQPTPGYPPNVVPMQPGPADGTGAPDGTETPAGQQPGTPPTVDWEARARELEVARQRDQHTLAAVRQWAEQQQQQAAEQQLVSEAQGRVDQAYQIAAGMETDQGLAYIRRVEDAERAQLWQRIQQVRQQASMHARNAIEQIAAPLYAQDLARQHNLPAEYAERLAQLPPHVMDSYLPQLVAEHRRHEALRQEIAQLRLSQQAGQMQASGAHTVGGLGAPASPGAPLPDDPQERELALYTRAPYVRVG